MIKSNHREAKIMRSIMKACEESDYSYEEIYFALERVQREYKIKMEEFQKTLDIKELSKFDGFMTPAYFSSSPEQCKEN